MKKVIALAIVALVLVSGTAMKAQSPDQQFGIGVSIGGGPSGAQVQYAFTPAFHLGALVGLELRDGNTNLAFAPYGKFIFAGSKEFKPFLKAEFAIMSYSSGAQGTEATTSTALNFGGGAEYFITPNFGAWGGITLLNLPLSPSGSKVGFGIMMPQLGVEWFM